LTPLPKTQIETVPRGSRGAAPRSGRDAYGARAAEIRRIILWRDAGASMSKDLRGQFQDMEFVPVPTIQEAVEHLSGRAVAVVGFLRRLGQLGLRPPREYNGAWALPKCKCLIYLDLQCKPNARATRTTGTPSRLRVRCISIFKSFPANNLRQQALIHSFAS
jgi:hypothetical protein